MRSQPLHLSLQSCMRPDTNAGYLYSLQASPATDCPRPGSVLLRAYSSTGTRRRRTKDWPLKTLTNLDFIRAVAVLSVVVEHTLLAYGVGHVGSWASNWIGVAGVFVFFVHTSLVLMWSLERKPHTLDFYIRRIFRIYPLAILVMLITVALTVPVSGGGSGYFSYRSPLNFGDGLAALLLVPNFYRNYLPVGVMWSLPYEVEMYLVLPIIFFFIRQNFSVWPLLLFWAFTEAICRHLFGGNAHNFFLCIPYFLPGVMAYVGFGRWKPFLPAWTLPFALAGAWFAFMLHPGWRRADFLCLGIGLLLPLFHQLRARVLVRASHIVAKYSYGAYLTHPFGIVLGIYCMPHAPLALQLFVIVASTTIFSVAAYHLVEHPLIRLGSRLANRAEARYEQHELSMYRIPPTAIR